ncbi:MAG TPA: TlpA disulfide reductase family protein [Gemmatimonadales bacterium]|nr:TlpA disulfide reductase family protein [Gemmatimonadales bacterium]
MRRQWMVVGLVLAGLGLGIWALLQFGPEGGPVQPGSRAPDFRAFNINTGDSVSLSDYRGRVTLVNIWATWCGPCRAEMPSMQRAYARLRDRGFAIAAVSIDEGSVDEVRGFQRELGLTFDILHDRSGRIQQVYQTTGVPESFLLDRKGVIVKRLIGDHDWASDANIAQIERLLGDETAAADLPSDRTGS